MIQTHKDLVVWQKSICLVKDIYSITQSFPKDEVFGLTSQMRRAAVSIPSNIAEGSGRNGQKEFVHFLYNSLGSVSELETHIIICKEIGLLPEVSSNELVSRCGEIVKMLSSLINSLKGISNYTCSS